MLNCWTIKGGKIGVMDAIVGQTMGGILFSVLAGQPLIVIMTTAPIALYIKIIVAVAEVGNQEISISHWLSHCIFRNMTWTSMLFTQASGCGTLSMWSCMLLQTPPNSWNIPRDPLRRSLPSSSVSPSRWTPSKMPTVTSGRTIWPRSAHSSTLLSARTCRQLVLVTSWNHLTLTGNMC